MIRCGYCRYVEILKLKMLRVTIQRVSQLMVTGF